MQVAIIDDLAVCRKEIKEYLLRYIRENYQGEEPELDEFESCLLYTSDAADE